MIRKFGYLFGFIILLLLATFLAGNKLLSYAFRQQFAKLPSYAEKYAVEVADPWFQSLSVTSPQELLWRNVSLRFRLLNQMFDTRTSYLLRINELSLRATDSSYRKLVLEARGIQIRSPESPSSDLSVNKSLVRQLGVVSLNGSYFRTEFESDPANPGASLTQRLEELASYMNTGKFSVPVEFDGAATFRIGQKSIDVPLTMATAEDTCWVPMLKKEALEPLTNYLGDDLTDPEVQQILVNPLRGAMLVAAKEYVSTKVKEVPAAPTDRTRAKVPIEAYRYVLWGYVLTKLVGPQFAQQVTEAHNTGSTLKNLVQRQSDSENAALGRRLAEEDVSQSDLLDLATKEGSVPSKRFEWSVK